MNTQLPLDLPPSKDELDLRQPEPPKAQEPDEIVRRAPTVCIGNCDICRYCSNSNNRG